MSELRRALLRFDGTHTAELVEALNVARADKAELVALCEDSAVAVGATWVVKALLEQGEDIDMRGVFARLAWQTEWGAQLHILQCVWRIAYPNCG